MKKQKIGRRILILALVLVLAAQATGAVSAASVSWTSGSNYYTATVSRTILYVYDYQKFLATRTVHTYGTSTRITTTVARTATSNWSGSTFPSTYSSYLLQAMHNEGLYESASYQIAAGTYVTIPANVSSGNYVMAVGFGRSGADWSVVVQSTAKSPSPTATGPSGSITYALTRASYVVTYKAV